MTKALRQPVMLFPVAAAFGAILLVAASWTQYALFVSNALPPVGYFAVPAILGAIVGLFVGRLYRTRLSAESAAQSDPLTGIPNRAGFSRGVDAEIARAERYGGAIGLLMFDVDKFKDINDTHGHAVGDQVLLGITEAVRSVTRRTDIFARWAGDEFVVLAPGTGTIGCRALAEKIRQAIATYPMPLDLTATVSIGVSHYVAGDDERSLLRRADDALYEAKRAGRNCTASSRFLRSTGTFTRA